MSHAAESIIASLALVNRRLADLAVEIRQHAAVRAVTVATTPRRYDTGDRMECYVDAELVDGTAVGCWIEFRYDTGSWVIESSVRRNTEEGEDELVGLPTRFAVDDAELLAELDGASAALVEAGRSIELADL